MKIKHASKNQIKKWRKLLKGKYRESENQFLAEGKRCVEQIIQHNKVEVLHILLDEQLEQTELPVSSNSSIFYLNQDEFKRITDTESPQGIAAVCSLPAESTPAELSEENGIIVAFDEVQDPGNVGTIIRTASWFNCAGLIFGRGTADPYQPKVVRSTAGATGALPHLSGSLPGLFKDFEEKGWTVCLLDGHPENQNIRTMERSSKTIFVVGNEARGVSEQLKVKHRPMLKIEGESQFVESLNAGIAAGIAIHTLSLNL